MPVEPQNGVLGTIFGCRGVPKSTLGAAFSAKKVKKCYPAFVPGASWSRPGRDLAPKTAQNDPRSYFYRFFMDFGPIWDRCWCHFSSLRPLKSLFFLGKTVISKVRGSKNGTKSIPNQSNIDENVSLGRFRRQVAPRSAPGRHRSTEGLDFLFRRRKMSLQGSILGRPENRKSVQNRICEARWALGIFLGGSEKT